MGTGGTDTQQSQTAAPGHKGPDLTKTIDPKKCTQPTESSDDPEKFEVPNFTYKNIQSVKECIQAAGWKLMTQRPVDENTYGEGTILEQYPCGGPGHRGQGRRVHPQHLDGQPGTVVLTLPYACCPRPGCRKCPDM